MHHSPGTNSSLCLLFSPVILNPLITRGDWCLLLCHSGLLQPWPSSASMPAELPLKFPVAFPGLRVRDVQVGLVDIWFLAEPHGNVLSRSLKTCWLTHTSRVFSRYPGEGITHCSQGCFLQKLPSSFGRDRQILRMHPGPSSHSCIFPFFSLRYLCPFFTTTY